MEDLLKSLSPDEDDIAATAMRSTVSKVAKYTKKEHGFNASPRLKAGLSLPRFLHMICWTLNNLDTVALDKEAEEDYEELATKVLDAISSGDPGKMIEAAELGVEICKKYHTPPASGAPTAIPTLAALETVSMMTTHRALDVNEEFDDPDLWLKLIRNMAEEVWLDLASRMIRAIHGHRARRLVNREVDPIVDGVKRLADGIKATKLNSNMIMVEAGDDGTVLTIQGVGPEFDEILRKDHYDLIEKKKETVRAAKEALRELDAIL